MNPRRTVGRSGVAGAAAALLALVTLVGGCATEYDASLADDQASTSTTSTLPSGSAADLLPLLVSEASGLSRILIDGGDEDASVARMRALWEAVKEEVNAARPELTSDFSANIDLSERAVQFQRAADADKAARNITTLADAYLGG